MIMNLIHNDDLNFVEEEVSFFATIPLLDDFRFVGWTKDVTTFDTGPLGYVSTDGEYYLPVFIRNFCDYAVSDEEDRENELIADGKNCAVFVHGAGDNDSFIKRYTTKEIKNIDFSFFDDNDTHEGFVYRSY